MLKPTGNKFLLMPMNLPKEFIIYKTNIYRSYSMKYITCFLVACLLLSGCTFMEPNLPPQSENRLGAGPSVLVSSYRMSVGDQVQINVWKNPELSLAEPIRPDGKISVPLVGDVMAVGLTPEQLASDLEKKLSNYIVSPNVTIILTGLQGQAFLSRIRITGAVAKNMSITYHQGMTVLDAILEAGSVTAFADANDTKLHRRTSKGSETYDIRLKDIMEDGDMKTNVLLLPGDTITVPESTF
jgi:polysaccharide export outer membrane protein